MFKIIACVNKKGVIGKDGKLLYVIKNDMANFARQTKNNVVIMGRNTFESLPGGKPLSDRINIVITSKEDWNTDPNENLYIVHSINDVKELCEAFFPDKEWFVIGGGTIYSQFLIYDLVDEMRLTIVNDEEDGDTFFPEYYEEDWYVYFKSMSQTSTNKGSETYFIYKTLKRKDIENA